MNVNKNLINKRAFTLIEFMIAMSIALLVATIASKAILSGARSANVLTSKVYGQKSVRSAISFIAKDLMAAESITNPAIGATGPGLTIQGSKFKKAAMTSTWSGNSDTTIFKAVGSSQGVAWTKGRPPVVYVVEEENGDPVAQSGGYTLDYEEGLVDFSSDPPGAVTADFSTDITITYGLDNNNRLMRGNLVIADNVENIDIFEREADKMFNIRVLSREFELRTTIDASTGTYVIPLVSPTTENLNSTFFIDENRGWVAGNAGALFEFDGLAQTWTNQSTGAANLNSINFADNSTGTIVGNNGTILQYAGGVWTPDAPVANNLTGVFNKDRNSIMAIGVNAGQGISYTYEGAGWGNEVGATGTEPFNDISESLNDEYVVANNGMVYVAGSSSSGNATITGAVEISDLFENDLVPGVTTNRGVGRGLNNGAGSYDPDSDNFPTFTDLTITNTGTLTVDSPNVYGSTPLRMEFNVVNNLTIDGTIDASAEGWQGGISEREPPPYGLYTGNGPGGGVGSKNCITPNFGGFTQGGGGGGYGGDGGAGTNSMGGAHNCGDGLEYSAFPQMPTFGSGGGAGYTLIEFDSSGGNGGGAIWIRANNINITGNVLSDGGGGLEDSDSSSYGGGGGSGGGIYIATASTINLGRFSAQGQDGLSGPLGQGGGGSGGRITISSPNTPTGTADLGGGASGSWESPPSENGTNSYINEPFTAIPDAIIWRQFFDAGNQNLNGIAIYGNSADPSNYFIWVAGNGGTLRRHDSNQPSNVWDQYTNTDFGNLRDVHFFNENIGWAVGDAGTILRYDGELDQWFEIPSGTVENLNDVFMYSRDEGYIVGDNGTLLKIGSVRL